MRNDLYSMLKTRTNLSKLDWFDKRIVVVKSLLGR